MALAPEVMGDKPTLEGTGSPNGQRDVGVPFIAALLFSLLAVGASLGWHYVIDPGSLTDKQGVFVEWAALLALLLGSAVALVLAVTAASQLVRGRRTRSWKSLVLTALASLAALPGLQVGALLLIGFTYSLLPLTAEEMRAIEVAEQFVERHGYTSAGHPRDLPVRPNDIMDPLAGSSEGLVAMRRGTLEAKAFGVTSLGPSVLVFFESIPPSTEGAYRTVEVNDAGRARILHSDIFPGFHKKAKR